MRHTCVNKSNCHAVQVVSKVTPISELINDVDCAALWSSRKLERKHAWAELRAICRMVDGMLWGDWISRTKIPKALDGIRPLAISSTSSVVAIDNAGFHIRHDSGECVPIIPEDFDASKLLIFGQLVDRCAVGVAHIGFIQGEGQHLWAHAWGISHDGYNCVRNSAKYVSSGSLWKAIVRMSAITNFHCGPHRSGAWGTLLQETHARLVPLLEADPERFDAAVERQQALQPWRDLSRTQWWCYFISLPMCTGNTGTIQKLSRWYSGNQAWDELKPQFWFLHVVFEEMSEDGGTCIVAAAESTSLWDAAAPAQAKGSRVEKTHSYFTEDLTRALDSYFLGSAELATSHRARTKSHLTIDHHAEDLLERAQGSWSDEAQRCLDKALNCPDRRAFFNAVPDVGPGVPSAEADRLLKFTVATTSAWIARTLPLSAALPESASCATVPGHEFEGVETLAAQCTAVVMLEKMAVTDADIRGFMADIHFLKWPLVRLLLFTAASEQPRGVHTNTASLAHRATRRVPDEQIPENCHQAVRDHQRTQRRKNVTVAAVFDQCITSGQAEHRQLDVPTLPDTAVAEQRFQRESVSDKLQADKRPRSWPKAWNKILNPRTEFTNLNVPQQLSATLSWQCLLKYVEDHREKALGSTWWCRLLKPGQAWSAESTVILIFAVGRYAALGVQLNNHSAGMWTLFQVFPAASPPADSLCLIENPLTWNHVPYTGARLDSHIALVETNDESAGLNVLQHALWNHRSFTQWEVRKSLEYLGHEYKNNSNLRQNTAALITAAFPDKVKREYVLSLYEKSPLLSVAEEEIGYEGPPPELDSETLLLLDELALDEAENATDLKAFKGDLSKEMMKKVAEQRAKARASRRARIIKTKIRRAHVKKVAGWQNFQRYEASGEEPAEAFRELSSRFSATSEEGALGPRSRTCARA